MRLPQPRPVAVGGRPERGLHNTGCNQKSNKHCTTYDNTRASSESKHASGLSSAAGQDQGAAPSAGSPAAGPRNTRQYRYVDLLISVCYLQAAPFFVPWLPSVPFPKSTYMVSTLHPPQTPRLPKQKTIPALTLQNLGPALEQRNTKARTTLCWFVLVVLLLSFVCCYLLLFAVACCCLHFRLFAVACGCLVFAVPPPNYFTSNIPTFREPLGLGTPGSLWVGHFRQCLGLDISGAWALLSLGGWALQEVSGVGHRESLGLGTPESFCSWALQGVALDWPSRKSLGLGTPAIL